MKDMRRLFVSAMVLCLAGASLAAHDVTFKGTVVTVETGKVDKITVSVVNEKTKKAAPMVFEIDKETKIFRGDVTVTLADARIQKGEAVAVTVNHDDSPDLADVIRLSAKK